MILLFCFLSFSPMDSFLSPYLSWQVKKNILSSSLNSYHKSCDKTASGPCFKSLDLSDEKDMYLDITGKIPEWLVGSHVKVGPAMFSIGDEELTNWFDGQSMLSLFQFSQKGLRYCNRFLNSSNLRQHMRGGKISALEFGSCPEEIRADSQFKISPQHILKRLALIFSEYQNNNVNCFKFGDHFVAMSETKTYMEFDLDTLETKGVLKDFNHKCHLGCAHPRVSNIDQKIYTIGLDFLSSCYVVSTICARNNEIKEKQLCSLKSHRLSYMHSFAFTGNLIILVEFPFVLKPLYKLLKDRLDFILYGQFEQSGLDSFFHWQQDLGTRFTVISKETGKVLGQWHTEEAFFAFHHLNAFVDQKGKLKLDMIAYDEPSFDDLDLSSLRKKSLSTHFQNKKSFIKRCEIDLNYEESDVVSYNLYDQLVEMPSWNENFQGIDYDFCYGVSSPSSFCESLKNTVSSFLVKVNLNTRDVKKWQEKYCAPGEAIFIAKPESQKEDEGILLSIVFDNRKEKSFILWIDATTFRELGRAYLPDGIPAGIHGQWWGHEK